MQRSLLDQIAQLKKTVAWPHKATDFVSFMATYFVTPIPGYFGVLSLTYLNTSFDFLRGLAPNFREVGRKTL